MREGILDEAYRRLHRTGPEYKGWLSNHGPMAVEALTRHGHDEGVHRWLDAYLGRLDELPRGLRPIDDWREALGDPKRAGDWLAHFARELHDRPWPEVLQTWWPRLLPGIAAGATHGVIRVGHAVRSLHDGPETPDRLTELGQALGYWAARWQPLPGTDLLLTAAPSRSASADDPFWSASADDPFRLGWADETTTDERVAAALDRIPRVLHQSGGIRERLDRLGDLPGWESALGALPVAPTAAGAARTLVAITHRAGLDYLRFGHADPVMLVHAVTAPTAVRRTLPVLPTHLWAPSVAAAWAATAAVTSVYAPAHGSAPPVVAAGDPAEIFARAARHGDAHVVKLADALLDVHAATGDERVLAAAGYAGQLI